MQCYNDSAVLSRGFTSSTQKKLAIRYAANRAVRGSTVAAEHSAPCTDARCSAPCDCTKHTALALILLTQVESTLSLQALQPRVKELQVGGATWLCA